MSNVNFKIKEQYNGAPPKSKDIKIIIELNTKLIFFKETPFHKASDIMREPPEQATAH